MHPNTWVLDCETAHSATDCLHCGEDKFHHDIYGGSLEPHCRTTIDTTSYTPIGWRNYAALGLSIGCYYHALGGRCHFFDMDTLPALLERMASSEPFLITFNGQQFDMPLLLALSDGLVPAGVRSKVSDIARDQHYDILARIWMADPQGRFKAGNSLGALSEANNLGMKLASGELAPVMWRKGQHAAVINYCQDDVYKTMGLFNQILRGEPLQRNLNTAITLDMPTWEEARERKANA